MFRFLCIWSSHVQYVVRRCGALVCETSNIHVKDDLFGGGAMEIAQEHLIKLTKIECRKVGWVPSAPSNLSKWRFSTALDGAPTVVFLIGVGWVFICQILMLNTFMNVIVILEKMPREFVGQGNKESIHFFTSLFSKQPTDKDSVQWPLSEAAMARS